MLPRTAGLQLFTTCPQSKDVDAREYTRRVADIARWSEQAGCCGILVYSDNGLVDPWTVSQVIVQNTEALAPLIAIQPVYMHPYTAAKMVASLGYLYGRRVFLNLIAGGFKNDLIALDDPTPHDERYDRLVEYALIMKQLLTVGEPVSFEGKYYRVRNLKMQPPLPPELFPGILMSGSSDAGLRAAQAIGATPVTYPTPPGESPDVANAGSGIRVGIIARSGDADAWAIAYERFPENRRGQVMHQLAMKTSDSTWHEQLSQLDSSPIPASPYWLAPFKNYQTFCPYLVGSYDRVAQELARYVALGTGTVILDIPASRGELEHIRAVFDLVTEACL